MMKKFKFNIGDRVKLTESGEEGVVIGRAEYRYATDSFLILYKSGCGRQVENWWNVEFIEIAEQKTAV